MTTLTSTANGGTNIQDLFGIGVGRAGFDGSVSDLRVYNTALTATQVGQLYNYNPGSGSLPATTSLIIAANAALDLGGANQQVASLADSIPGSGGSVINTNLTRAAVLTLSPTSGSTIFSGGILSGGTNGAISLVLNGAGTQVLAGNNTYNGTTTISGGTLQIGNGGARARWAPAPSTTMGRLSSREGITDWSSPMPSAAPVP